MQNELLREYPTDVLEDHIRLSDWVRDLAARHSNVEIRIIDPQSLMGIWKSLRHGVRKYPTFIINAQAKYTGWDRDALERVIQRSLREN